MAALGAKCHSIMQSAKVAARKAVLVPVMNPAGVLHDLRSQAAAGDMVAFEKTMEWWQHIPEDVLPSTTPAIGVEYVLGVKFANDHKTLALHRVMTVAAREGQLEVVRYLIDEHGCLPYFGAVRSATEHEQWDILELFLERGWDINAPVHWTNSHCPLIYFRFNERHVRWYLAHGANPNWQSVDKGRNVCTLVAQQCGLHILEALKEYGADFSRSNALHGAALGETSGRVEVLAFLLDNGFPINQLEMEFDKEFKDGVFEWWKPRERGTALHRAVSGCCVETLRFLLDRGADRSIKDTRGSTPLELARSHGNFKEGVDILSQGH